MKKAFAIASKELKSYFTSPVAYIALIITLAIFNIFFFMIIDHNREATLRDMFQLMEFMLIFIIPILTMRSFSEEKMTGTIEFLMTCPVKRSSIVLGKYLGSLTFFSLIIFITLSYYAITEFFTTPDVTATFTGYLGIWLEGALFIAICILISSLTKSQLIAAMSSYAILFLLYFSVGYIKYLGSKAQAVIKYICFMSHSQHFNAGTFALSDIVYFISGIAFCLAATLISLERKS